MKKFVTLFAILAAAFVLSPQSAEARHGSSRSSVYTYVSGHTSCGCKIYTKRVFCHYDCYGRPVYTYHRQPVTHRCRHHRSGHGHRNHYRGNVRHTQHYYGGVRYHQGYQGRLRYSSRPSYGRSSCGY